MWLSFPVKHRLCYNLAPSLPEKRRLAILSCGGAAFGSPAAVLGGRIVLTARSVSIDSLHVKAYRTTLEHPRTVQDELTLLEGVRRLDAEALEQVHNKFYPAIFRYITYRVGDQATAEDLTSEVFTRLLSAVRDRSSPQNSLRGWLYGVASRVVADHHRRKYRMEKVSISPSIKSPESDPAEIVSNRQTLEALHLAMDSLTNDQQEVIALRFGFEMPIREVAQVMGKSEGAIKQLQARAVAALSRKLARQEK